MAVRWSIRAGVAAGGVALVGGGVAAVICVHWFTARELSDPAGRWVGGAVAVELRAGGDLGPTTVPVAACDSSTWDTSKTLELQGTWKAEYEADAGYLVVIYATRSDNGRSCSIWLGRSGSDQELWLPAASGLPLRRG
ncbi:hypothetical protein [Kitasatospora sp. NPDC047058]|uniref:hypothetical protein n=1 Tax=Kitasatospora sp. NPDC047058 TaxID=3155620 RepID=UPI00340C1750